jgi:hypothetical protein
VHERGIRHLSINFITLGVSGIPQDERDIAHHAGHASHCEVGQYPAGWTISRPSRKVDNIPPIPRVGRLHPSWREFPMAKSVFLVRLSGGAVIREVKAFPACRGVGLRCHFSWCVRGVGKSRTNSSLYAPSSHNIYVSLRTTTERLLGYQDSLPGATSIIHRIVHSIDILHASKVSLFHCHYPDIHVFSYSI